MRFNLKHIFVILIMAIGMTVMAQPDKQEKVEAAKVSFITQKLSLTTKEAQSFWPLYNEYTDKIKLARRQFRRTYGDIPEFKTDAEAENYLSAELKLKETELDLHKEYYEKFKKVLGAKKTGLLRRAEEEFKKEIIKTIKGSSGD